MSPDAFKIPNSASTPVDVPETTEEVTDMFSDLYSLVAAPAAVAMPSTIDPALLSLDAYPPPDVPADDVPVTEMIRRDVDIDFHSILTFHNTLQAVVYVLDRFLAEQVVSEKVLGKQKRED
ncbi:hypothetical protein BKA82DRAFT_19971 [Pisolithus tinctorius]|uniref:Uncharacterized protein n=1 Tax=Pisolithus tinctorius Marx 270 TaxID=870435 RepID=A0A0C3PSI8_PISTI|nr:hypothetical protein BKA82DRAFT_19971 [Pisolithus tinctorius]KIO12121.1 hypothetical protein M404DRAFT_19971 [Pisolithus tinctorius Marx 270]